MISLFLPYMVHHAWLFNVLLALLLVGNLSHLCIFYYNGKGWSKHSSWSCWIALVAWTGTDTSGELNHLWILSWCHMDYISFGSFWLVLWHRADIPWWVLGYYPPSLSSATTLGQSEPRRDGNERELYIPQSSSITESSSLDCLVSWQDTHWESLTPLQRFSQCIQQPQPTAPWGISAQVHIAKCYMQTISSGQARREIFLQKNLFSRNLQFRNTNHD